MFKGKFNKNFLTGIITSLAINMVGGVAVEKKYQEVKQEEMTKDREQAKDIIFLPTTEEELVQNLLEQAGVKNIAEIQKNPELAHKIDLGRFFIQVEFLEKKIDAIQAKKAVLNLELQVKVFSDLYNKTKNPLLTANEIQNNVSDPQIFLTDKDEAMVKQSNDGMDYQKGEALSSSYWLNGKTNCYSSVRVESSILYRVLPKPKLKINGLQDHVRLVMSEKRSDYLIDPGTPIREITPDDLSETILYEDAQLAFLSGILKLPNSSQYFANPNEAKQAIHGNLPKSTSAGNDEIDNDVYKNTSIGNYFDNTQTNLDQNHRLKKLTDLPIPKQADRARVQLPAKLDLGGEKKYNEKEISKLLKTSTKATKTDILSVEQKKQEEKEKVKEKQPTIKASTDVKLDTGSESNLGSAASVDTSPTKKIEFVLLEADPMIDAFIRESLDDPKKENDNSNEIMLWLKKLDENGQLETYTEQHAQEVKKLETLRPKPGEKAGSYLQAKFLVGDYIKKYYEFKNNIDEKELIKSAEKNLLENLTDFQYLLASCQSSVVENPLSVKKFGISEIPKVSKKIESILNKSKNNYGLIFSEEDDIESVKQVLEIAKKYPPNSIRLWKGFQHLQELQQFLDSPKMKEVNVIWETPPNGTSLKPIWKAIEEGRVRVELKTLQGQEPSPSQFSMIDKETKTIIDVNTPELKNKFGKEYIIEYFAKMALDDSNVIKLAMVNDISFPKSGMNSFGIQDFEILSKKIAKFANEEQTKRPHKYLFGGQRHMGFPDDLVFNFIEQLDLSKIAKFIPKKSKIEIFDTHIANFPTDDISCDEINLQGASFGDIPSDFLTKNKNIKFGLIASGLNIDNYFSDKRIDTFLKKISGAEMDDILITDGFVEGNDHLNNNKMMVLHNIEIMTNANGSEYAEENYSFKIEINLGKEYGIENIINNILNKIKTKKVFFGEGFELGLKQSIEKNHPQITFDDSDFIKRGYGIK